MLKRLEAMLLSTNKTKQNRAVKLALSILASVKISSLTDEQVEEYVKLTFTND